MAHTQGRLEARCGLGDTLTWYARGQRISLQRDRSRSHELGLSASLHGFDEGLARLRLLRQRRVPGARRFPAAAVPASSWYFLPWHRGYRPPSKYIVRDAIVRAGRPGGLGLPYWNYSDAANPRAGERPAFAAARCRRLKPPQRWPALRVRWRRQGGDRPVTPRLRRALSESDSRRCLRRDGGLRRSERRSATDRTSTRPISGVPRTPRTISCTA
jgi:hypothetical protein